MKRVLAACAASIALAICGTANATTFTFSGAGGDLPDRIDFSSLINVGQTFTVQDVNLTLNNLQHTYWGDLDVYLSHAGTTVMVHDEQGGGLDPNGDFTFDDEASLAHAALGAAGGTFQPLNPLSAFDGLSSAGDWSLRIFDDAGADAGALGSWTLTLTGDVTGGEPTGGVPEPATWVMMLAGFFGLGSAIRRRRGTAVTA